MAENFMYEKGIFQNNIFTCSVEGDRIVQVQSLWNNQKNLIGYTVKAYNDLKDIANQYYNKLVEAGLIEKEKTQEDLIKEQQNVINEMFSTIKALKSDIDEIRQNENNKQEVVSIEPSVKRTTLKLGDKNEYK